MKKIFLVLLGFAFIKAEAQTVDEIVQKYANAAGGLDNFKKISIGRPCAPLNRSFFLLRIKVAKLRLVTRTLPY